MSSLNQILTGSAVCALAAAAVATPADAQQGSFVRDHNKSVHERAVDEHMPLGIHTGSFLMLPRLDLGVEFNDNIYAATSNETDDTIFTVAPSVEFDSQWSVHRLNLYGGVVSRNFMDASDDNVTDWRLGADGQLDIRRDTYATGHLFTGRTHEPRNTASGPANLREPIEYKYTNFGAALVHDVNRLRGSLGFDFNKFDYKDGQIIAGPVFDQDFRDHDALDVTGRLDYAISPDTALFGSVTHRTRDYKISTPDRDSEGWRYLVGANFDLSANLRGEVGVGYQNTSYDNPAFRDVDGFTANGRVEWFPTQLTTLTFTGVRDTIESDVNGASSIDRTGASARIDHELRRDIVLNGEFEYNQDDYQAVDRQDDISRGELGVDWYVNRLVTAGAAYQHTTQNSSGLNRNRDFDVNQVMFTISLRR